MALERRIMSANRPLWPPDRQPCPGHPVHCRGHNLLWEGHVSLFGPWGAFLQGSAGFYGVQQGSTGFGSWVQRGSTQLSESEAES